MTEQATELRHFGELDGLPTWGIKVPECEAVIFLRAFASEEEPSVHIAIGDLGGDYAHAWLSVAQANELNHKLAAAMRTALRPVIDEIHALPQRGEGMNAVEIAEAISRDLPTVARARALDALVPAAWIEKPDAEEEAQS